MATRLPKRFPNHQVLWCFVVKLFGFLLSRWQENPLSLRWAPKVYTLPETKTSLENRPSPKRKVHLPTIDFSGRKLAGFVSGRVISAHLIITMHIHLQHLQMYIISNNHGGDDSILGEGLNPTKNPGFFGNKKSLSFWWMYGWHP